MHQSKKNITNPHLIEAWNKGVLRQYWTKSQNVWGLGKETDIGKTIIDNLYAKHFTWIIILSPSLVTY